MVHIGNDWDEVLREAFASEWYASLRRFLKEEYSRYTVYPDMHDIFNALKATAYSAVKVVLLGQDPYHNPGEAHGMCFSVKPGVRQPPSLQIIVKHHSYRAPRRGLFPQRNGVGKVDRSDNRKAKRQKGSRDIFVVGSTGASEKSFDHESVALRVGSAAPIAAFGLFGIFRLQAFFKDQRHIVFFG